MLVLRIGVGATMTFYGLQKAFGLFGGRGFSAQLDAFEGMGISRPFGILAILGELCGGLGVLFGALTPVAAFGVLCTMAVATYKNATGDGALNALFTSGNPQDANRIFYPLVLLFGALTILIGGAGRFAVDTWLFGKGRRR